MIIYPVLGECFSLPAKPGIFRMLQGEDLCINASTRPITTYEYAGILEYYEKFFQMNTKDLSLNNAKNFYDEICIYSDHKKFQYNISDMTSNYDRNYFQKEFTSNGVNIKFIHSKYGHIKLSIMYYKNPYIKSNVKLEIENINNDLSGLFIYQYHINKSNNIQNLHDCSRRNLRYIKDECDYIQKSKL